MLDGSDLGGASLRFAYLHKASLSCATLRRADLSSADLTHACLVNASLKQASLDDAFMNESDLTGACFDDASLRRTNMAGARINHARFYRANLTDASLRYASIVDTDLEAAVLNGCAVYGVSAWNVNLDRSEQKGLIVTERVTVDNLEIAQFIHLLLRSNSIRSVIDELSSKLVLILGRFTRERRAVLDAVADEVRRLGLIPVIVDFEKPKRRDVTETVSTLAHLARFVVADITEARSVPQELSSIVPSLPSVPVLPLLGPTDSEYGMFEHFKRYPSVLPVHRYRGIAHLRRELPGLLVEVSLRVEGPPRAE